MYVVLILITGYLSMTVAPVRAFCNETGYNANPLIMPFLLTRDYSVLIFFLGLVLLFCDAPFIESEQPYIIMRTGRKIWVLGQFIYIILTSALYFAGIIVLTALLLLPNIYLGANWGKVINTFAAEGGRQGMAIAFDKTILVNFTPITATLWCLLLSWLVGVFTGMLMFVVNLRVNRFAGSIIGAAIGILPTFVRQGNWFFHYFSPASWVSMSVVDFKGITSFPSLTYVLTVLFIMIFALAVCSVILIKRKDMDVLKAV